MPAAPEVLRPDNVTPVQTVLFENITVDIIKSSAKQLHGSGGPTLIDSDIWTHIICSRLYGRESDNLAEAIAGLAKADPSSLPQIPSSISPCTTG